MISFAQAQQLVINQAKSFGSEKLLLDDAAGRVLAETIVADRDYPPFNRAMMDGFAINFEAWQKGIRSYTVAEVIYAGATPTVILREEECYKIMTGAGVPAAVDVVIRREDAEVINNHVTFNITEIKPFQNIAKQGEDLKNAQVVINQNIRCNASVTGLLASLGRHEVLVEKLPTVAIVTTGDEVVPVDSVITPVQIRNSNAPVLKALLKTWDIIPTACVHVPDNVPLLTDTLNAFKRNDILIICGGVSAGDADYVPQVLESLGAEQIFHKIAIRPGKPIWFGKFKNGAVVFALPGNPFSCMVNFKLFIEAFLYRSFNIGPTPTLKLPLQTSRIKKTPLDEFFPVTITGSPSVLQPVHFNSSGDITAAMQADALAHHPAGMMQLTAGIPVVCYPF